MKLTSPSFPDDGPIPAQFTCDGDNLSPELHWANLPAGTASLALICDDPDAPSGIFVHWVMWGLEAPKGGLGQGELPTGAHLGRNNFGQVGYGGPCPPPGGGVHHYHFTLYALDREITLPAGVAASDLRAAMADATVGIAELVGTYQR